MAVGGETRPASHEDGGCRLPVGTGKKLASIRCRFTVSEFMATTSVGCAAAEGCKPGGQVLVIRAPTAAAVRASWPCTPRPRPLIELFKHELRGARGAAKQPQ